MIVSPLPWRCSDGMPALVNVRLAISPSTYDSVNFFEPITTGSAAETEKQMRKAGRQEKRKCGSQETTKNPTPKFPFLDCWIPDSAIFFFPAFLMRFIDWRARVER